MTRTPDYQKTHDLAYFIAERWTTSGRFKGDEASFVSGYSTRQLINKLHKLGVQGTPGGDSEKSGYLLDKEGFLPKEIIDLLTPEDVERLAEVADKFIDEVTRAGFSGERRF